MPGGKKGKAKPRVKNPPKKPSPPAPLPKRAISKVPERELFDALTTQSTLSAAAAVVRVELEDLVKHLGHTAVGGRLRAARVAAGLQADTRVVSAAPMAVAELVELAQSGTHLEGTRVFAARAILEYSARVLKVDRAQDPDKKLEWGAPPEPFNPSIEDDEPAAPKVTPGELATLPPKGTA